MAKNEKKKGAPQAPAKAAKGSKTKGGQPNYNDDCVVKCACGASFATGSILKEIKTEICSSCHPYFTGKQKFVDTAGRVERFKKKYKIED
jgi:large subunit ribosomal protein L31